MFFFPVMIQKKNRVGRSVKKYFGLFFVQKYMFYVDWELEGWQNLRVDIFFEQTLVRVRSQETNKQ